MGIEPNGGGGRLAPPRVVPLNGAKLKTGGTVEEGIELDGGGGEEEDGGAAAEGDAGGAPPAAGGAGA